MSPSVSAIIVNYNGGGDLLNCLQSLRSQEYQFVQVIVVDNGSKDGSLSEAVARFPEVTPVTSSVNDGFAGGANRGARLASGDVLMFLNPDVDLAPSCTGRLVEALSSSPGVAGPTLVVGAEMVVESGCTIDRFGYPDPLLSEGMPLYVPGSVLATSSDYFARMGGFDERYFMFAEDVDYCWRVLLAGGDVTVPRDALARHLGGGSTPGGYVRLGRMETTSFRIALRERNAFATVLKCAPKSWLCWVIPAYLIKALLLTGAALCLRKPVLARSLLGGLAWNARQLPATLRRRRAIPRTPAGSRAAVRRIRRGVLIARRLVQFGMPRLID